MLPLNETKRAAAYWAKPHEDLQSKNLYFKLLELLLLEKKIKDIKQINGHKRNNN